MTLALPFCQSLEKEIEEDVLASFRKEAWKKFMELGLPSQKQEAFQYINLKGIYQRSFSRASLKSINPKLVEEAVKEYADEPYIVLYNGHFSIELSSLQGLSQLIIQPLNMAFNNYSLFLKNTFNKWIREEKNPFALLNIAMQSGGVFIYVPNDHQEEAFLRIVEINDGQESTIAPSLVMISCGKNSSLSLASVFNGAASSNSLSLSSYYFNLAEYAKVSMLHMATHQAHTRLEVARVTQKKASHYHAVSYVQDIQKVRSDYQIQLQEMQARVEVLSLTALKGEEEAHTHILVQHQAEECYSRQLVKNLYDESSFGSFEGKIYVEHTAQKTNAYQLNQNCLLSDDAVCYSKPNLEIFADDVKASHGSTTGQIDAEQLFYLQSRGLSKKEACKLLLQAFCADVVEEVALQELQTEIYSQLSSYFERLS